MKKRMTLALAFAIALWGTNVFAQGHGHGRPESTGLEHAEATANPHGERGIENAETNQGEHKKHKSKKHKNVKSERGKDKKGDKN